MRVRKRFRLFAWVLPAIWMGFNPAWASTADPPLAEEARQLTELAWHGLETLQPNFMAAPLLKQALQADPNSAWAHWLASRAAAAASEARFHKAEAYRLALFAPQPERGLIEAEFLDAASRASKLDRLAKQYPAERRLRMALGKSYLEVGAVQKAVTEFEHALRLDPGTARAYVYLADCAMRLGDLQSARRHYRSALARLHPQAQAESLWGGLAMTYLAQGDVGQALWALQDYLPLSPRNLERFPAPRARFGLAPESSPSPSALQHHRFISRSLEKALHLLRSKQPL